MGRYWAPTGRSRLSESAMAKSASVTQTRTLPFKALAKLAVFEVGLRPSSSGCGERWSSCGGWWLFRSFRGAGIGGGTRTSSSGLSNSSKLRLERVS